MYRSADCHRPSQVSTIGTGHKGQQAFSRSPSCRIADTKRDLPAPGVAGRLEVDGAGTAGLARLSLLEEKNPAISMTEASIVPLQRGRMRPDDMASGSNPGWELRRQVEFELPCEELLVSIQFGPARQDNRASVSNREVNVEHLDGCEFIEDGPGSQAAGQRFKPCA